MRFSSWVIIIAIIVIIILFVLGMGWWFRNRNPATPQVTKYTAPLGWGPEMPGPNSLKNTCQLYQFPSSSNINNVYMPGTPTFNPDILNQLQGSQTVPSCLDFNQLVAQQVTHTCQAPLGVVDGQITRCFLLDGGTTGLNGSEIYYSNNNCPALQPCPGALSLISVNFDPETATPNCLTVDTSNNNVYMSPCDPTNNNQIFRITRTVIGQNSNSDTQNGPIAQIAFGDFNSQLCLSPADTVISASFNCNIDPPINITGNSLTLTSCTGGSSPGYTWAFLPSIFYSPGCTGTTGCTGTITPPQITYIGNIDISSKTGSSLSQLYTYLISQGATSLISNNTSLLLYDMGTNVLSCLDSYQKTQYMSLNTYNKIINQPVCLQNISSNCVNF